MLDPLVKTVDVACNQKMAFETFINGMADWWPLDKFTVSAMAGASAKTIRVDARPGGEITEIGGDDSEVLWGVIQDFNPHEMLSMSFHIPRPGDVVLDRSHVKIRFVPISDAQTRVELTQTNWQAFGDIADSVRSGYDGGWAMILDGAFKTACGG